IQQPVKDAALLARDNGWDTVAWRINMPSFSVYRGMPTPRRAPRDGEVVLTRAEHLPQLGVAGLEILYARGGVVLARLPPGGTAR
ncbi:MAG: hypothetical protein JSW68_11790, partial [Burkholderiales bacterium]